MKLLSILAVLLLTATGAAHPIHISVMDMEYDAEEKALQVALKIFIDDLEANLIKRTGDKSLDLMRHVDTNDTKTLMEDYINEMVAIEVNRKEATIEYLGQELEGDAMWCYFEVQKVKRLKALSVTSRILLDRYDDQQTIVNLRANGSRKTLVLDLGKPTDTFEL